MAATAPIVDRERPARGARGLIRRRAVLLYFALTFVIAWGGAILAALRDPGHLPATAEEFRPYLLPAMLIGFSAPAVSGLLLTWLVDGRAGLNALRTHLRRWRVGARWYAFALLAAPVAALALLLSLISSEFVPALFVTDMPFALLGIGLGAGVAAGFLEELGWTGFAVPRLRSRHSLLATGLLVGFIWATWHLVYAVMRGTPAGGLDRALFVPEVVGWFLIVLPAYRVLLVWVHDHTRSLPIIMVMHGSLSATTGLILAPGVTGSSLAAYYLAFGALTWIAAGLCVSGRRSDHPAPALPREMTQRRSLR